MREGVFLAEEGRGRVGAGAGELRLDADRRLRPGLNPAPLSLGWRELELTGTPFLREFC